MNHDRGADLGQEAHQWMLLSAASILACGSCLGIASVVLCYLALQDAQRASLVEAENHLRWGKRITVGGVFLSAFGGGVAIVLRSLG